MKPEDIIVKDKNQRADVLKMINSRANGKFKFDNSGKLELVSKGSNSSGSDYYTDKLVEGIKSK
ncbi:hypothetical protein TPENAI_60325 [Tenacibaculum litopenaei]|jgi:hypothetical protein|uniref:hypothetical protein n=1 Tax=Tenacibaculum litopenaei TaxID=396016 RepID=UPI003895DE44